MWIALVKLYRKHASQAAKGNPYEAYAAWGKSTKRGLVRNGDVLQLGGDFNANPAHLPSNYLLLPAYNCSHNDHKCCGPVTDQRQIHGLVTRE